MTTDDVLREVTADHGGRAKLVERSGLDDTTTRKYVKCYNRTTERYGRIDGDGTEEVARTVKLTELPASASMDVLRALAELHGYRLEPK